MGYRISMRPGCCKAGKAPAAEVRTKFTPAGLNPLGFLALFAKPDRRLLTAVGAAALIGTCEQKQIINLLTLWLRQNVRLTIVETQRFVTWLLLRAERREG